MATIFFGGCTPTADHPAESKKLAEYIQKKFGVEPIGCCRVNHPKLTEQDTAIVVCNNCANIIAESGDPGSSGRSSTTTPTSPSPTTTGRR